MEPEKFPRDRGQITCKACGRLYDDPPREEEIIRSWDIYSINLTKTTLSIALPEPMQIHPTRTESLYIMAMIRASGRLCSKEYLQEYVYGNVPDVDWPAPKIADVMICKVRRKLGALGPKIIETNWGKGYRLVPWAELEKSLEPH